jgi:hypothetical protein
MTDAESHHGPVWKYRFITPDGAELEVATFGGDGDAEVWGQELSRSHRVPVTVERHSAHVDAWEYVTEADERS